MKRILALTAASVLILPAAAMAEGMPQLDFKTPLTISQVVWGAIIFIVLYILLSRQGLPLVGSVLEERASHIARDLDGARTAKATADADTAEAEKATAKARAESQAAIKAAVEAARAKAADQAAAMNTALEARLHEAEVQITAARAAAMGALRQVATDTAVTVVTRLTGTTPDTARVDGAVSRVLAARGLG